jgi:hypothetical protein
MPIVLLLVSSALLTAGCGDKKITQDEVESKAQGYLDGLAEQRGGQNAARVSCPGDLKAKAGETMRCTASDRTGELTVLVRVNSVDGDESRRS